MKPLFATAEKDLYSGFHWKKAGRKVEYAKKGETVQVKDIAKETALCKFNNGQIGWVNISDIKFLENE